MKDEKSLPKLEQRIKDNVVHHGWKHPVNQYGQIQQITFMARLHTFNHGPQTVGFYQNAVVSIEDVPTEKEKKLMQQAVDGAEANLIYQVAEMVESHIWVETKYQTKWHRFLGRIFTYYHKKYPLRVRYFFNEWEPLKIPHEQGA